jgi:hypothetical protein
MLCSFLPEEGSFPLAGLIEVNHTFYGTTPVGGAYNHGTIFSLTPPSDEDDGK